MKKKEIQRLTELKLLTQKLLSRQKLDRFKFNCFKKVLKNKIPGEVYQELMEEFKRETRGIKEEDFMDTQWMGFDIEENSPIKKSPERENPNKMDVIGLSRKQFMKLTGDEQDSLIKVLTNPSESNRFRQDLAKYYLGLKKNRPKRVI